MENRKKLHDYSLVMILISVLGLFNFVATIVGSFFDGTIETALASVDASILTPVKIALGVVVALMALLVLAEAFIGIKGLKVSRQPNADKGYITVTKVFFVINIIAVLSFVTSLFGPEVSVVDTILTLANTVLDIVIYAFFIKYATAVRKEFIANK